MTTTPRRRRVGLSAWLVVAFVAVGVLASLAVLVVVLPTLERSIRDTEAERIQAETVSYLHQESQRAWESNETVDGLAERIGGDARLTLVPPSHSFPFQRQVVSASLTHGFLPSGLSSPAVQIYNNWNPPQPDIVRVASRRVRIGGRDVLQAANAVYVHGDLGERSDAILEIARPMDGVPPRLVQVQQRVMIAVAFVLGLASLVGVMLARFFGSRIRRLAGTAALLARGELSARAEESSPQELTSLAGSINRMASRLEGLVDETVTDRDRARALVSALVEGVIAVSDQGEVTVANGSARTLLRLPENVSDLRLEDLPDAVRTVVGEAVEMPGAPQIAEAELRGGHHILLSAIRLSKEAGTVITLRDVTEERGLDRARRDLIANVSHELKTPLTAVKGFLELMESENLSSEQRAEFLKLTDVEVQRLERLIAEQLELARIDAGALPLDREMVDMSELADGVTGSRSLLAEREGIELVTSHPDEPVMVHADPARLEQLLLILLDNALKNTEAGGKVIVGVSHSDQDAFLTVRDTGTGIPIEAQQFIFDRYYQADESREGGGLGLGLSIARGLAEAHDGSIEVRSAPGIGSVFTVRLPRIRASSAHQIQGESKE